MTILTTQPPAGQPVDPREGDEFFLTVPSKLDNPFPDLEYFRENRPVFYYETLKSWYVFCYDDVSALFHDPRASANRMKGFVDLAPAEVREGLRQIAPYLESWMLMKDGQDHLRVRSQMQPGLTPLVVQHLAGVIRQSADKLLDQGIRDGRLDACEDYAFLLPAYVLSDLFGVRRADRTRLVQWSVAFVDFFNIQPITVDTTRRLIDNGKEMIAYTKELLAGRRDDTSSEFLSLVIGAQEGAGGLTADEIAGNIMLLLLAGHVAVRNLMGNALYLLLAHHDQFAKLKNDPTLLHSAIEETMRYEAPVTMIPRVAVEDFDLRGNAIKQGQVVQLSIASANRDAAHFQDGEQFDITRPAGKHLSFGTGPHGCFGAALAREITAIGLELLLARMPNLSLDPSRPIRWYRNAANRGPINLPVMSAS